MSCPDWAELARRRLSATEEPESWKVAVRHLDGCDDCRADALAADPLLAFRRVGRERAGASNAGEEDVRAMCAEVRAVARSRQRESRRSHRAWPRFAAAAAFLVAVLTLGAGAPRTDLPTRPVPGAEIVERSSASGETLIDLPLAALMEGLDRPGARVYEMRQLGVSVVMIVDDTLDI